MKPKKIIMFFTILLMLFGVSQSASAMISVGGGPSPSELKPQVEEGWKRLSNNYGCESLPFKTPDSRFLFATMVEDYGDYFTLRASDSDAMYFSLVTDKLKIFCNTYLSNDLGTMKIEIDNMAFTVPITSPNKIMYSAFEVENLPFKLHTVKVYPTSGEIHLDAIDINSNGSAQ